MEVKEIMSKEGVTIDRIQKTLEKKLEGKLQEDEVVIVLYGSNSKWGVFLYPKDPDFNIVENLVGSCLIQIKALAKRLEDEQGNKKVSVYTV